VSVLLINYELKDSSKNYAAFFDAIQNSANEWWHFLDHTWIVTTDLSADQFAKRLYPHMLNTDSLLVVRLQKEYQGWLVQEAWEWLNEKQY
jgi:hypothetical protein